MARIVLVIAPKDFRDEELFHAKEELEKAGNETAIAGKKKGKAIGSRGGKAEIAMELREVREKDFDAIVFIGGGGAEIYFNDAKALGLAKEFAAAGKIVAAICIAPSILANAGLLKGKRATCFSSEAENLKSKGTDYTGKAVEVDGKIITANGPAAAREFGRKIAEMV